MTSDIPDQAASDLPWLTVDQMRAVDRAMVEDYAIWLVQMREQAKRQLALAAARRLASWGAHVHVLLGAREVAFAEVPRHQPDIARRLALPMHEGVERAPEVSDLIRDGLIGYGLQGSPRGDSATLIRWANASGAPILALDLESSASGTDVDA